MIVACFKLLHSSFSVATKKLRKCFNIWVPALKSDHLTPESKIKTLQVEPVCSVSGHRTLDPETKEILQKSIGHHKILNSRRSTWSKYRSEDPQMLSATVQNIAAERSVARHLFTPNVKLKQPSYYKPMGPRGFWAVKAPDYTRHMKVVRSSPLRIGRLYPQEYPGTRF